MVDDWFEIVIVDNAALSGRSVFQFIKPIIVDFAITHVVVADLEGAIFGLSTVEGVSISAADFLSRVSDATQYDWAFFFLLRQQPLVIDFDAKRPPDHRLMLKASPVTVRLVDDYYFYVYTQEGQVAAAIAESHPDHGLRKTTFDAISLPY